MLKSVRLLVVTYAFPPYKFSPGGMIRVVKFLKYIGRHRPGWAVDVVTAGYCGREGNMQRRGEYLLKDVPPHMRVFRIDDPRYVVRPPRPLVVRGLCYVGRKVWYSLRKRVHGGESARRKVPRPTLDPFISWHNPVIDWLVHQPATHYDAVLVTVDPYSVGLLGVKIKEVLDVPLIVDIRDDWPHRWGGDTEKRQVEIEMRMEEKIVGAADRVVLVTPDLLKSYQRRYPEYERFVLIPNGVDLEDFAQVSDMPLPSTFRITYLGKISNRDPISFFQAFKLFLEDPDVGEGACSAVFPEYMAPELWRDVSQLGLESSIEQVPMLELEDYKYALANSSVLLSINVKGYSAAIAGKMYEYWATGRPILLIDKDGAGANLVRRFDLGLVADPDDVEGIHKALRKLYFQPVPVNGRRKPRNGIEQFSREELTKQLIAMIESLLSL
jgi:glycosyltransferase involved in cell wall biosynthesis